jgi:hypothetical protein
VEVLLVYLITFSLRFAERSARWLFFPNDDMVLAEREQQVRPEGPPVSPLPSRRPCHSQLVQGVRAGKTAQVAQPGFAPSKPRAASLPD